MSDSWCFVGTQHGRRDDSSFKGLTTIFFFRNDYRWIRNAFNTKNGWEKLLNCNIGRKLRTRDKEIKSSTTTLASDRLGRTVCPIREFRWLDVWHKNEFNGFKILDLFGVWGMIGQNITKNWKVRRIHLGMSAEIAQANCCSMSHTYLFSLQANSRALQCSC